MKIRTTIAGIALVGAAGLGIGACGGSSAPTHFAPPGGSDTSAPATLTRVTETDAFGDGSQLIFHNYWSDGTMTTCMIHVFPNGYHGAGTGQCIPEDTP
jgi:hypothetical protein